jgi:hypothetical protein
MSRENIWRVNDLHTHLLPSHNCIDIHISYNNLFLTASHLNTGFSQGLKELTFSREVKQTYDAI